MPHPASEINVNSHQNLASKTGTLAAKFKSGYKAGIQPPRLHSIEVVYQLSCLSNVCYLQDLLVMALRAHYPFGRLHQGGTLAGRSAERLYLCPSAFAYH
eukprot:scaffold71712_cov19-Tisochrysis_lutea.AAC.3